MILRSAALASIIIGLIVAACGGSSTGTPRLRRERSLVFAQRPASSYLHEAAPRAER